TASMLPRASQGSAGGFFGFTLRAASYHGAASQTSAVVSSLPDTSRRPSGENATEVTRPRWHLRSASLAPVTVSQMYRSPQYVPSARRRASGEKTSLVAKLSLCCHWCHCKA